MYLRAFRVTILPIVEKGCRESTTKRDVCNAVRRRHTHVIAQPAGRSWIRALYRVTRPNRSFVLTRETSKRYPLRHHALYADRQLSGRLVCVCICVRVFLPICSAPPWGKPSVDAREVALSWTYGAVTVEDTRLKRLLQHY